MFEENIKNYLDKYSFGHIRLKAVLFDMDGVLFDSMPCHAGSWAATVSKFHLAMTPEETYEHEGRTGRSTINILAQRYWGRNATEQELKAIYQEKCRLFNSFPEAPRMPGALELLRKVRAEGFQIVLVTGSGQLSLLGRLNRNYPDLFQKDLMVTSFDVKHGKPSPEPYLKGLQKACVKPWEAVVIENAPLGVRSAVTAKIFTIAVNTGPLPDSKLLVEGANALFPSMQNLADNWELLRREIS